MVWAVMDSNHRRLSQLSYSQPHLATLVTAQIRSNSVLELMRVQMYTKYFLSPNKISLRRDIFPLVFAIYE